MTPQEEKYRDAKTDVLKAMKSVGELDRQQQEQLVKELMGTETAIAIFNLMRLYFG